MGDTETKSEPVLVSERRGAVLVLRLNRPEARNALNPELLTAIGLGMAEAENDPDVRAVVLTGTGEKAFCAGMDLRAFAEGGGVGGSPEGMRGFAASPRARSGCPSSVRPTQPRWPVDSNCCSAATWWWRPRRLRSGCPRSSAGCSRPAAACS